jgi:hypothetical protein
MVPDRPSQSVAQVIAKLEAAIQQLEALMLSDAWGAIPAERQQALAHITEQMRADLERLTRETELTIEPFADED